MMKKNPNNGRYSGYNNRPHKIPDPKLLDIGITYAFSLNPASKPVQYAEKNDTFKYNYRSYTNAIMSKINKCNNCEINMYPELSSSGKWHYHGYLKLLNVPKFMLYDINILRQYFCFEIDIITDKKVWDDYVTKCKRHMEPFCKEEKIPYELLSGMKPIKLTDNDKLFDVSYLFDDDIDELEIKEFHNTDIKMVPES